MKYLLFFVLTLFSLNVYSQAKRDLNTDPSKKGLKVNPKAAGQNSSYICPKCGYTSKDPASCPKHKCDLLREKSYYCPHCEGITSMKAGTCPKCKGNLKQVVPAATQDRQDQPMKNGTPAARPKPQ